MNKVDAFIRKPSYIYLLLLVNTLLKTKIEGFSWYLLFLAIVNTALAAYFWNSSMKDTKFVWKLAYSVVWVIVIGTVVFRLTKIFM